MKKRKEDVAEPDDEVAKKPSKKGRSKIDYPVIPPREPAPNHRGKKGVDGVVYPGFNTDHPQYCKACEVLRRGFLRTGKKHNDDCRWRCR